MKRRKSWKRIIIFAIIGGGMILVGINWFTPGGELTSREIVGTGMCLFGIIFLCSAYLEFFKKS